MFRNNAVVQRIHMQPNESIGASFDGSFANTRTEGSGTRPDYLANCADKKIEGPLRKNWTKRQKNREIAAGWAVGKWAPRARWQIFPIVPHHETKYKHSKNAFALTSIALRLEPLGTKLLELSVQSPIGSPSTLHGHESRPTRPRIKLFLNNTRARGNFIRTYGPSEGWKRPASYCVYRQQHEGALGRAC